MTTDLQTGKIYIGQHHVRSRSSLDNGYFGSGKLLQSIIKARKETLTRDTLAICRCQEDAGILERFFISIYESDNPLIGYNISSGSTAKTGTVGTHPMSERGRESLRMYHLGKKVSERTRLRRSMSLRGIVKDELWRRRLSESQKGRPCPAERREKLRVANSGKPNKALWKPIIDTTTGKCYKCVKDAGKDLGVDPRQISAVLAKKQKSCREHTFNYLEEKNEN